jgi:TPR repeat protein
MGKLTGAPERRRKRGLKSYWRELYPSNAMRMSLPAVVSPPHRRSAFSIAWSILAAGAAVCLTVHPLQAAPADQEFRKGLSAYHGGRFDEAMRRWLPLAGREDAPAQAGIGFMYYRGLGVAVDYPKAAFWLRKAAQHGQPEGQMMLGTLYFYGRGVEQSYVWSYAWCDLAQNGGNADASMCRDASLQSLANDIDLKKAFRLSVDLHKRFGRKK